jgi:hypothetical protein
MQELSDEIVERMRAIDEWTRWASTQQNNDLNSNTLPSQVSAKLGEDGVRMLREMYASK